MADSAEKKVSLFYNTIGWETEDDITEDARRWEDLRENAREYVSKCRMRVLRHIPEKGKYMLDMASGPIQYKEYILYSSNFAKRYCIDLSSEALQQAKIKIGDHGVFLHGNFFDIPLEKHFFDCTISLHTIYHIHKDRQEAAVRKLIHVTKPGSPIIIVYSNPDTIFSLIKAPLRLFVKTAKRAEPTLYFHAHPNKWWKRFNGEASVKILPWRSFDSNTQKKIIPDNRSGRKIFDSLFYLEDRFPHFFATFFRYPMIILTKKNPENKTP